MPGGPAFLIRFIAVVLGAMAILAGFVELVRDPGRPVRPVTLEPPLRAELARCGDLPIAEAGADAGCKALWYDMRAQFLAPMTTPDREAGR